MARGLRPAAALRFTRRAAMRPPRCLGARFRTRAFDVTKCPILATLPRRRRTAPRRAMYAPLVVPVPKGQDCRLRREVRPPPSRGTARICTRRTRRPIKPRSADDRVAPGSTTAASSPDGAPQRPGPGADGRVRHDTFRPTGLPGSRLVRPPHVVGPMSLRGRSSVHGTSAANSRRGLTYTRAASRRARNLGDESLTGRATSQLIGRPLRRAVRVAPCLTRRDDLVTQRTAPIRRADLATYQTRRQPATVSKH